MRFDDVTDVEITSIKYLYKDKYNQDMKLSNHDSKVVYAEYKGTGPTSSAEDDAILEEIREQEKELGLI